MKNKWTQAVSIKWMLALSMSLVACKQAGYEVLKPGLNDPQSFDDNSKGYPTARIEAVDRGVSVTWTFVGNKIDIKPSADTVDPDYVGKVNCENPGIIRAAYDLGNGKAPVIDRNGCSSLSSSSVVFDKAGDYLIKMQVTSQDNETATASMTLRVIDKNTSTNQIEGGFTVHAKPLLAALDEQITLTGICELKGKLTIRWNLGDNSTSVGAVVQHKYNKAGQYVVSATCSNESGKTIAASLTIVVMKNPPKLPEVPLPVPGKNPNLSTGNCDATQGPCQSTSQVPQGSQQLPTTSAPVWYYDPYCRCYYTYNAN